jgi:hypothetical protein
MSKNTRRKGGIAEEEKNGRCSKKPRKKALKRETPQNKHLMTIWPRAEQQADFKFHKSGEEKKGNEGEQQPQQVNEEEEEEVQWKRRKRGAAAAAAEDKGWRKEEEEDAAAILSHGGLKSCCPRQGSSDQRPADDPSHYGRPKRL